MSNQFKMSGSIKVIGQEQQVTEKFSKREFVVTDTSSQYPQDISFQLTKDKCSVLDQFMEGENVEVSFNLRGREWTSPQGEVRYFNTLEAWRIEKADSPQTATLMPRTPQEEVVSKTEITEDDDSLPF
jgi:hypothetical protein